MTVDPAALLAYRVQILNAPGALPAGRLMPSPRRCRASPVEQLRATPTRDGAMLEWQHKDTTAGVELHRLL
jgi:hypothetical protein